MNTDREERALVALLAKTLIPEAQSDPTKEEIEACREEAGRLSSEEQEMLATLDPMSFRNRTAGGAEPIAFPAVDTELPQAAGFYRGNEEELKGVDGEAIAKRRQEIVARLRERREGGPR